MTSLPQLGCVHGLQPPAPSVHPRADHPPQCGFLLRICSCSDIPAWPAGQSLDLTLSFCMRQWLPIPLGCFWAAVGEAGGQEKDLTQPLQPERLKPPPPDSHGVHPGLGMWSPACLGGQVVMVCWEHTKDVPGKWRWKFLAVQARICSKASQLTRQLCSQITNEGRGYSHQGTNPFPCGSQRATAPALHPPPAWPLAFPVASLNFPEISPPVTATIQSPAGFEPLQDV